jgi:hypothetical protein
MATLSQTKGRPKATRWMLRHSHTPTSTDIYQQVISDEVEKMADSVHNDLRKPSSTAGQIREMQPNFAQEGSARPFSGEENWRQGGELSWWTWSGSNRRPLPCHCGGTNKINNLQLVRELPTTSKYLKARRARKQLGLEIGSGKTLRTNDRPDLRRQVPPAS